MCVGRNFCRHAFEREPPGRERRVLRLRYLVFDGERNYEIDFLRVLAVQLLDFQVSFVVCTDSFNDSTGASDSVLDLVREGLV